MHRSPILRTAMAVLLSSAPVYLHAQENLDLGTIIFNAEGGEAAAVESIPAEDIDFFGARDAKTLFQNSPNVQGSTRTATTNRLFINGLETNSANVTIDGAPVGSQVWHHSGSGGLNPRLFKQADVYAGITPADIGPNATAGALVFTTVDAQDLLRPGQDMGASLGFGYESNGGVWSYEGSVFGTVDQFDYLLYLGAANGGSWKDGDGDVVPLTDTSTGSALVKLGYDLGEGRRISFSSTYYEDSALRNIRGDVATGNPNPTLVPVPNEVTTHTYTLEYTDDLVEGLLNPELRLSYSTQDQFQDRVSTGKPPFSGAGNVDVETDTVALKAQNRIGFAAAEVRFGVDYLSSDSDNLTSGQGESIDNTGLFVQADIELTEQFRVSAGLRYDWTEFTGTEASGFSRSDDGYSANLYAEYDATSWLTLDAGISHVFGGYDFSEVSVLSDGSVYTDGAAETSDNYRAGFNVALPNGFFGGAHVFRTEIEDAGSGRSFELAGDTIETKGWDGEIGYRFKRGLVALNYINADVRENGALLSGFSDYSGAPVGEIVGLQARYAFDNGLTVGGSAELVLDYDVGDQTLPSYSVVNLIAEYSPPAFENVNVRFSIDNLLDETYASRQGRDLSPENTFLEPGRSASLFVTYSF